MTEAAANLQGVSSRRLQVPAYSGRSLSIIVPLSLVAGLTLGIAVFTSQTSSTPAVAKPVERPADLKMIFTPARPILAGARLERADFRELVVHESEVPSDSIPDAQMVFGQYAKVDLEAGKPIRKGTVSKVPTFKTLLASIPIGYRGITIGVDATGGIEGWSKPGAHVDVIVSYFDKRTSRKTTMTAVEDAIVISFNGLTTDMIEAQKAQGVASAVGGVPQYATVTLSVPLKDALRIQTAKMMGALSLVLRNPNDNLPVKRKIATPEDLRKMLPNSRNVPAVTVPVPKIQTAPAPVVNPDGFARYHKRNGELIEMELWGPDWKRSEDSAAESEGE